MLGKPNLFFPPLFYFIFFLAVAIFSTSAMWSDVLKTNISLTLANDCVIFVDYFCSDMGSDPQANGFSNFEGKDVANCMIEPIDIFSLRVILSNTYPGYSPVQVFEFKNVGTIPVKFCGISITGLDTNELKINITTPDIGTVYNPGESSFITINTIVNQEAKENSIYSFQVELCFKPWYIVKRLKFTSWKALAYNGSNPRGRCLSESGSVNISDYDTLARVKFNEFRYGWGWVGLVISNSAGEDVELRKEMINIKVIEGELHRIEVFLYGPFQAPGTSDVWDKINICEMYRNLKDAGNPFPESSANDSIILRKNEKAVIWIYLEGKYLNTVTIMVSI